MVDIPYSENGVPLPSPQVTFVKPSDELYFYSYCADTIDFLLLQFLLKQNKSEILNSGINSMRSGDIPIVIFETQNEKDDFLSSITSDCIDLDDIDVYYNQSDPLVTMHDRRIIEYTRLIKRIYDDKKSSKITCA